MSERNLNISHEPSDSQEHEQPIESGHREHWIREQRDNRDLGNPRGTRRGEWKPCPLCAAGIPNHH